MSNKAHFTMTRKQYLANQVQVICPHCNAKFSRSRNDWRTRCPLCLKDTARSSIIGPRDD